MGGGNPSTTRTIQDIPSEFKPAYTSLYNSAFGAARQGAYPQMGGMPPSMGQFGNYGGPGMMNLGMGFGGMQGMQSPYQGQPGSYQNPMGLTGNTQGFTGQPGGLGGTTGMQPGPGAGGLGSGNLPFGPTGNDATMPIGGGKGNPQGGMQLFGQSPGAASTGAQPMAASQGATPAPGDPLNTPGTGPIGGSQPSGGKGPPWGPGYGPTADPYNPGDRWYTGIGPDAQRQPGGPAMGKDAAGGVGAVPALPPGNIYGSNQIPLAGGEPIVGQPFPGPFTAATHPLEAAGQWGKLGAAGQMQGMGENLLNLGQQTAQGDFLRAESNPYLQSAMMAAMQPATEQFSRSILPGMESQAINSGAFKGSSARDMATAQLGSDFGRNLLNTTSQMAMQNYGQERQLQQGAGQMMDQAARLMQLSPELQSQVGQAFRGFDQRMLDEMLLNYQEQIQAPFRPLMPLASIIQGGDIGRDITQMTPQPSAAASGITGALGGAGLGADIASTAGWGNLGTGVSSGLGALGGGLASML